MNKLKVVSVIFAALFAIATSIPAHAIDQVVLKNGSVVEGKILSDVPNRHVDIQLLNGTKKRYQQSEVASTERDVPSDQDRKLQGSDKEILMGLALGGLSPTSNSVPSGVYFNYGARFGVNLSQLGDFSKFAFVLSYHSCASGNHLSELMAELLFRKVSQTGFYFGPELGMAFYQGRNTLFNIGGLAGYDYHFTNKFSMGPELHFTSNSYSSQLKYLLGATWHY